MAGVHPSVTSSPSSSLAPPPSTYPSSSVPPSVPKQTQWADFELPYTAYGAGGQNGRVNLAVPPAPSAGGGLQNLPGFGHMTTAEPNFMDDMLRGNFTPTALARAFFTPRNAAGLQEAIRREVYVRSGPKKYVIDDQDIDELKMIMRAIYLQYGKNNEFDIEGQLRDLNKIIVDWSAPRILSEIDQYMYYLDDISHLPVPMAQPMSMSSAGTRSLPFQLPT
jgi:hypothetical protein